MLECQLVEIEYFGLSAFRLRGKGVTVVTDPYGRDTGLKLPRLTAEIVTVSHDHFDHNFIEAVSGTAKRSRPLVVAAPGEYEAEGVSIYGFPSWHDETLGAERGKNTVFVIYIDGVRVAHLGDLGHILTDKQVEAVGKVAVLLVPEGVVEAIGPGIVVPMHYKVAGLAAGFDKLVEVEEWVKAVGEVKRMDRLVVDKEGLPESTEYVVLQHG